MPSLPEQPDLPGQVVDERFRLQLPSLPHWIEAAADFLCRRAVLCGACGAEAVSWERSSGRGRLFTWTVTHQALLPTFAEDTPYVVAVVELLEGVRLVSGLRGVGPGELRLDLPLEVDFAKLSEAIGLHFFRPAGAR